MGERYGRYKMEPPPSPYFPDIFFYISRKRKKEVIAHATVFHISSTRRGWRKKGPITNFPRFFLPPISEYNDGAANTLPPSIQTAAIYYVQYSTRYFPASPPPTPWFCYSNHAPEIKVSPPPSPPPPTPPTLFPLLLSHHHRQRKRKRTLGWRGRTAAATPAQKLGQETQNRRGRGQKSSIPPPPPPISPPHPTRGGGRMPPFREKPPLVL